MTNVMVKSEIPSLPVCLAQQEVSAFSCILLIDPYHFQRMGVSRGASYNGEVQNVTTYISGLKPGSLIRITVSAPLMGSSQVQRRIELLNLPPNKANVEEFL